MYIVSIYLEMLNGVTNGDHKHHSSKHKHKDKNHDKDRRKETEEERRVLGDIFRFGMKLEETKCSPAEGDKPLEYITHVHYVPASAISEAIKANGTTIAFDDLLSTHPRSNRYPPGAVPVRQEHTESFLGRR